MEQRHRSQPEHHSCLKVKYDISSSWRWYSMPALCAILAFCAKESRVEYFLRTMHTVYHYKEDIMSAMASHITDVSIVCLTVGSGADQRNHQSSASLAFVQPIHRWPVNSPHKRPVTRKMFPFDDVIMYLHVFYSCLVLRITLILKHEAYYHQYSVDLVQVVHKKTSGKFVSVRLSST